MQTKEWSDVKAKKTWAPGPWQSEPDRKQWLDLATGLPCLIARQPELGHWCGYVAVPPGHPLWGLDFMDDPDFPDLRVHGGVTYTASCSGRICHDIEPGDPHPVWWIGFDCWHADDLSPSLVAYYDSIKDRVAVRFGVYRDMSYVQKECARLARQLEAMQGERKHR